jgi:hypothetical protein
VSDKIVVGDTPLLSYISIVRPGGSPATSATLRDGSVVSLDGTGTLTDPTALTLVVWKPDGSIAGTYTWAGLTVTKYATGVFDKQDLAVDVAGTWTYKWTATGTAANVQDGTFLVSAVQGLSLYVGLDELRSAVAIYDGDSDVLLESALHAACRSIDGYCARRFYPDTTATARVFRSTGGCVVWLDDFYTIDDLVVKTDTGYDGTFGTTWASTDYLLEPLNGIVSGLPGWPYDRLSAVGNYTVPCYQNRPLLQVTAKWGWAAPPEPVRMAAKMLAKDIFKNKDVIGGVLGTDQFGAVRVRQDPMIAGLLAVYRSGAAFGIA